MRPNRGMSHTSAQYLCMYFAAIIVAWVPCNITANIACFQEKPSNTIIPLMYGFAGVSVLQMILGALFLTYTQHEHTEALSKAFKAIKNKLDSQTSIFEFLHKLIKLSEVLKY